MWNMVSSKQKAQLLDSLREMIKGDVSSILWKREELLDHCSSRYEVFIWEKMIGDKDSDSFHQYLLLAWVTGTTRTRGTWREFQSPGARQLFISVLLCFLENGFRVLCCISPSLHARYITIFLHIWSFCFSYWGPVGPEKEMFRAHWVGVIEVAFHCNCQTFK